MKKVCSILIAASLACVSYAQTAAIGMNNDEILATVGINVPMYRGQGSEVLMGIHYGHFWHNGFGFRAGVQYAPYVAEIEENFGIPVAFTFRTRSRSASERLESGLYGAYQAAESSVYYGGSPSAGGSISGFLMNLFDRVEFYAGLTPGYIAGGSSSASKASWGEGLRYSESKWVEKAGSLAVSADAGINLNFRIWRFDLKLMPAFHYNVTGNYRLNTITADSVTGDSVNRVQPLRWFFTFNGGLAFRF